MKTILVAYDDTEPSRRALERAATLAEAFGSRVLVTSIAPLHYSTPRLTLTVKERGEGLAAREEDMRQAQAILEERGIAAESLAAMGDPATRSPGSPRSMTSISSSSEHASSAPSSACLARASARRCRGGCGATC